jgi:division/cell wall cluster transcriptional repressor MraZ
LLDVAYPSSLTLDQRFRLCLPVEAREGFQPADDGSVSVVLGKLLDEPCLWLMTRTSYAAFIERVSASAGDAAKGRRLKTILVSSFARVSMDPQGRITIPEGMIAAAKIKKSVKLVGHGGDRIEIWATEVLEEETAKHAADASRLLDEILSAPAADVRKLGAGPAAGVHEGEGRRG